MARKANYTTAEVLYEILDISDSDISDAESDSASTEVDSSDSGKRK